MNYESPGDWMLAYGLVSLATFLIALAFATMDSLHWKDRRDAARVAFLCWAWPALLCYWLYLGIRGLWKQAGWKR